MNCPQYMYEGQSLSCHCLVNPASPGFPPATAQWQGSSPGKKLVITDVTRDDAGRVFMCSLTWGPANDTIVKTSEYELIVAYPPPSPPVITGHENKSVLLVGERLTLTCTVTGGRPLVTSLSVRCWSGVQSEPSAMTVVNNSVTLTFSIEAVEARHDGTECVCTGDWEGGREAYNASGRIVLTVIQGVNVLAWQVVAGASGCVALVVFIVVVVVARRGQRRENDDNISAEFDALNENTTV
ncbi:uncharacterized protein [Littorina saxatilis]|uniref:uncharacterized protein n=1 Tax=Littorina saxatilis TaxID=31220 RepID=UPI0038B50D40